MRLKKLKTGGIEFTGANKRKQNLRYVEMLISLQKAEGIVERIKIVGTDHLIETETQSQIQRSPERFFDLCKVI